LKKILVEFLKIIFHHGQMDKMLGKMVLIGMLMEKQKLHQELLVILLQMLLD